MRTEKERERDAKPSGPVAELVARVQHMLQAEDLKELQRKTDAEGSEEG